MAYAVSFEAGGTISSTDVRTAESRIVHCLANKQEMLSECIARQCGLTREQGHHLISFGSVYVEQRRAGFDRLLSNGQYVRVHVQPKRFPVEAVDWPATIIYCKSDFLIVNKPAGIPVHATVDNGLENVLHRLNLLLGAPVYITHRLDSEASGLMVFARTREFQREFNQLLTDRKVRKCYFALVLSPPEPGWHTHYMEPSERSPRIVRSAARPNGLECTLRVARVTPVAFSGPERYAFEVELDLKTGRTHQIRAQLAAMGSPIVGDRLYGSQASYELHGIRQRGIGLFSAAISWPQSLDGAWEGFMLSPPWRA